MNFAELVILNRKKCLSRFYFFNFKVIHEFKQFWSPIASKNLTSPSPTLVDSLDLRFIEILENELCWIDDFVLNADFI